MAFAMKGGGVSRGSRLPLRGGGVGHLMANAILNFHFDYRHTSLPLKSGIVFQQLQIMVDRNFRDQRRAVNDIADELP